MARIRSPNYPAISLPDAIERTEVIHKTDGKKPVPREVIAKHLGFGGLNGASLTVLSALGKYGLIEPVGSGEARVSDLAMRIMYPHDPDEQRVAIEEAAFRPALFAKFREKWPDRPPSEETLRSYLIREGFSQSAVNQVIQIYRETFDMAAPRGQGHDSDAPPVQEPRMEPHRPTTHSTLPPPPPPPGRPFTVSFDGAVLSGTFALRTARDIDRLVKVLQAQKAALEAMEDKDEDRRRF